MKKRKELDALLGKRCRSYHQLQHNDVNLDVPASSSSHDVYFHPATSYRLPAKKVGRSVKEKNGSCTLRRCFYFSLPLCLLALIAACITSSVGVVWMQMQLKSDIDQIKDRMLKLERWKIDQISSLADVQESLRNFELSLTKLEEVDIRNLHQALATFAEQMNHYSVDDVTKLQKNVTLLNETLLTTRTDVSNLKKSVEHHEQSTVAINQRLSAFTAGFDEMQKYIHNISAKMNQATHHDFSLRLDINSSLKQINSKLAALEQSGNDVKQILTPLTIKQNKLEHDVNEIAAQCSARLDEEKLSKPAPKPASHG